MSAIELQPPQQEWFLRIAGTIYPTYHCYIDTSETGRGKTIVALAVAKHYGLSLFVVGIPTLRSQWTSEAARYGVELAEYVSYQSLRGSRCRWLEPSDDAERYQATRDLTALCEKGTLFVFDEWQNSANLTAQYYAARAVCNTALQHPASYCALLSATPMTCDKQVRQLLHFTGVMVHQRISRPGEHVDGVAVTVALGYQELEQFHQLLRRDGHEVAPMPPLTKTVLVKFYTEIVKPFMVGGIVDDTPKATRLHRSALHCSISRCTAPLLKSAIHALSNGAEYDAELHVARRKGIDGSMLHYLGEVHKHMSELFVARALEVLDRPLTKVVLFLKFKAHISLMRQMLEDVTGVLVLDGSVPQAKRGPAVDDFTGPDMTNRVLITQIRVGGVGVNMQSRVPGMQIHGFCVPDWSFVDIEQAAGRIYRSPYLNDAHFSVVYPVAPGGSQEIELHKLIEAIDKASTKVKAFVDGRVSARKVAISDYPVVVLL